MIKKQSSPFLSIIHLQRLNQLDKAFPTATQTPVEVSQLAALLSCTERNVSKLMVTLQSKGCIQWSPGRGRGNKSTLTILMSFEEALLAQLESQAREGHIDEAFRYAEQFDKRSLFQDQLPQWLAPAQAELSKQNTLVYLVPYTFPEWRPPVVSSVQSIMLIESIFDTLVKYDHQTGKIIPHIAHHFEYQDNQYRFRIRDDVFFHNGEKLQLTHLKDCFNYQITHSRKSKLLFRHVQSIAIDGQWLLFNMKQFDPVFLHVLADIHYGIFLLDNKGELSQPIGTGTYKLSAFQEDHWVLEKNRQYFAVGGLIEKAEFWSSKSEQVICSAHVQEISFSSEQSRDDSDKVDQDACNLFEFVHHENRLSVAERSWLMDKTRQYVELQNSDSSPLANSITPYHQDKGFHLFNTAMRKPSRPIVIMSSRKNSDSFAGLVKHLESFGVVCEIRYQWRNDDLANQQIDILNQCYVFSDNTPFQYYRWLLTGNIYQYCLDDMNGKNYLRFIDSLMADSQSGQDFLDKLYRVEDWLIQNGYYMPLWRHHARYTTSQELHGTETNSMGVMSLARLWLE